MFCLIFSQKMFKLKKDDSSSPCCSLLTEPGNCAPHFEASHQVNFLCCEISAAIRRTARTQSSCVSDQNVWLFSWLVFNQQHSLQWCNSIHWSPALQSVIEAAPQEGRRRLGTFEVFKMISGYSVIWGFSTEGQGQRRTDVTEPQLITAMKSMENVLIAIFSPSSEPATLYWPEQAQKKNEKIKCPK